MPYNRRRRRSRATWFPIVPTLYGEEGDQEFTFWEDTAQIAGEPGSIASWSGESRGIQALTFDQTLQPTDFAGNTTLRDMVQGQDWVCERVVGKVWGNVTQSPEAGVRRLILCAALAVLPVNDDGSQSLIPAESDPLNADNSQQPWLWRRTWTLFNNDLLNSPFTGPTGIGNIAGGNADAGHLDTKGVKRRIRRDQRLFIVYSAVTLDGSNAGDPGDIIFGYDLRLVGGMRNAKNQSTFK